MQRLFCVLVLLACCFPIHTASAADQFTDVTVGTGIRLNTVPRPGQPEYGEQKVHGVAVEDFDGDGRLDIIVVCFGLPAVQLFRNAGDLRFEDVTKGSGLETFEGWGTGAAVGDYDRDGILDVFLTSLEFNRKDNSKAAVGKHSRLYRGLGRGKFQDVTAKTGTLMSTPGRSCAWSDIDHDGWLDLFVTCPYSNSVLFRNNHDGTFTDIAAQVGVSLPDAMSLGCAFGDIDGDGFDDVFVTNYDSQVSTLLKNSGGRFTDITPANGPTRKASSVGVVFADVWNRDRLDLYETTDSWLSGANSTEPQLISQGHAVAPNLLLENDGQGKFKVASGETLLHKTLSHDAIIEDLDHDGWLDIYVGVDAIPTGNKFATHKGGNPMWTRKDGQTWSEVRKEWGVGFEANCVCVPAADFDNDGDLDLLLINFYKNIVLYRNNTDDQRWLKVKPVGVTSNPDGIGAWVRLYADVEGKRTLVATRHIQSGEGYGRSSQLEAHFGLGRYSAPEYQVEVFFPATKITVVNEHVKPAQRIIVREANE